MVEMHEPTDLQLLRGYATTGSEAAFRELVARHTDFVFSAARRQVESSDLAGDLAQGVFTDLARKARALAEKMPAESSLAGWLHRCTRYAALNHLRDTRRRENNERQAMEQLLTNTAIAPDWELIRPLLDDALNSLGDDDREALLLRYFKNQDFRAVGQTLGVSDDTAQKRVSRAVERLCAIFAQRKVTIGAGGLAVLISANAVQAAPAGLATTISAAALLTGTAVHTSTIIAATKTIAMTTMQKTLITAALAAAVGTGIYKTVQAHSLQRQVQTLQQMQADWGGQIQSLQRERNDATNRLAGLLAENARFKSNLHQSELLKLRGKVDVLRQEKNTLASQSVISKASADPGTWKAMREQNKLVMAGVYFDLDKRLKLTPEQTEQFNDLLANHIMDKMELITQTLHDGRSQAEVRQIFSADETAFAGKVQTLLGDEAMTQYLDYTKNLASRRFVSSFADSLTGDAATIEDKKNQLRQALQQATQSALATAGLAADYQTLPLLNSATVASEAEGAQSLQLLDSIFGQAAASATNFLSADELNKFQDFRTTVIKGTQAQLLVNRKLMAPISK